MGNLKLKLYLHGLILPSNITCAPTCFKHKFDRLNVYSTPFQHLMDMSDMFEHVFRLKFAFETGAQDLF
jgi:hypothetical protein